MDTTANPTVETAAATAGLTVVEEPMTIPAALKAMNEGGSLTAVVAVDLDTMLDARGFEEAGEDYVIGRAMAPPS